MSYWKYMSRVLIKLLVNLFLWYLLLFLRLYLVLTVFFPTNYQKIATGSLNGCDIFWIQLCSLKYISKFPIKLLVTLCFGNFQILLKSRSLFNISAPQKQPKNHQKSLKQVWHKRNLLFLLIIYVKIFNKLVFLFNVL